MSDSPAIQTVGLSKDFGDVRAVDGLDLEVRRGEVFGFLGPNGAGKTTTIRTVLDLIRPTEGSASILGMDSHRDAVAIRRQIGYLPGDLAMYPNLTGHDTLTYFANLRGGVDWPVVEGLADRLDADLSRKVGDYSTGNRQKIGLIQAFMNVPDVIIMDEPSTGLDPLVQQEFQAMMREVAAEGRTVFLSSHTLSEVQRVAHRVGIIRQGRLVDVESVHDLRSKALRRVEMTFAEPVASEAFRTVEGVSNVAVVDRTVTLSFEGSMAALIATATDGRQLIDISTGEADLEEIFLAYYRTDGPDDVHTSSTGAGVQA